MERRLGMYGNDRSRSRSPVRRRLSDDRDRYDDYNNSNSGSGGSSRHQRRDRGSRFNDRYDQGYGRYHDDRDWPPRRGGRGGRGGSGSFRGGRGGGASGGRGRSLGPIVERDLEKQFDATKRNFENSIFVRNLTFDCTPEDLKELFGTVGEIVEADIITSKGHHRGMGTVEFTNNESVQDAISKFDGALFMDRKLMVRQDNPPPEASKEFSKKATREEVDNGFEVFIINLPYSINWQSLKDMFKECGRVLRADVELDFNGFSRGFGSVIYPTKDEMMRAIDTFNGMEVEGRVLEVREGRFNNRRKDNDRYNQDPQDPEEDIRDAEPDLVQDITVHVDETATKFTEGVNPGGDRNCFIHCSNLPFSTARSDLFDLFGPIGKINNAELKPQENGQPTGVAVVEYENLVDADFCIQKLNNYNYGGCSLQISYAKRD
ncbi:g-strand binding protein [Saccharomyces pastorianus]|uniref:G-strand binding protein n=1 Tax=Saccharomyces pastorianus TaxID=27292 RepID=A0A6C1E5S0_SACPS|nr:g-strand binding protein [Saccharomyces pastorianus]